MSDPGEVLATPLTVVRRTTETSDIEALADIIRTNGVGKVIVGLPVSLSGEAGAQALKVKSFIERFSLAVGVPVEMRDERLSTVAARRMMREAGGKKSKRGRDDASAAAVILQGYLDEHRQ